jgi:hypothetical protein
LTSLAKRLATTPPPPTRDTQQLNMAQLSYDEKHCVRFLNKFKDWPDPTWGFWVYGTYSRPQGQSTVDGTDSDTSAQEAAGQTLPRNLGEVWQFADERDV